MKRLQLITDNLRRQKIRKESRKTYRYGWCNFNKFLINLDCRPDSWDEKVTLFAAQLIEEKRMGQTVRSYVSAVRTILKEDGVKLIHNYPPLTSLQQSTKYTTQASGNIRLYQFNGGW